MINRISMDYEEKEICLDLVDRFLKMKVLYNIPHTPLGVEGTSLLNGKTDICLFVNKPGLCFKSIAVQK